MPETPDAGLTDEKIVVPEEPLAEASFDDKLKADDTETEAHEKARQEKKTERLDQIISEMARLADEDALLALNKFNKENRQETPRSVSKRLLVKAAIGAGLGAALSGPALLVGATAGVAGAVGSEIGRGAVKLLRRGLGGSGAETRQEERRVELEKHEQAKIEQLAQLALVAREAISRNESVDFEGQTYSPDEIRYKYIEFASQLNDPESDLNTKDDIGAKERQFHKTERKWKWLELAGSLAGGILAGGVATELLKNKMRTALAEKGLTIHGEGIGEVTQYSQNLKEIQNLGHYVHQLKDGTVVFDYNPGELHELAATLHGSGTPGWLKELFTNSFDWQTAMDTGSHLLSGSVEFAKAISDAAANKVAEIMLSIGIATGVGDIGAIMDPGSQRSNLDNIVRQSTTAGAGLEKNNSRTESVISPATSSPENKLDVGKIYNFSADSGVGKYINSNWLENKSGIGLRYLGFDPDQLGHIRFEVSSLDGAIYVDDAGGGEPTIITVPEKLVTESLNKDDVSRAEPAGADDAVTGRSDDGDLDEDETVGTEAEAAKPAETSGEEKAKLIAEARALVGKEVGKIQRDGENIKHVDEDAEKFYQLRKKMEKAGICGGQSLYGTPDEHLVEGVPTTVEVVDFHLRPDGARFYIKYKPESEKKLIDNGFERGGLCDGDMDRTGLEQFRSHINMDEELVVRLNDGEHIVQIVGKEATSRLDEHGRDLSEFTFVYSGDSTHSKQSCRFDYFADQGKLSGSLYAVDWYYRKKPVTAVPESAPEPEPSAEVVEPSEPESSEPTPPPVPPAPVEPPVEPVSAEEAIEALKPEVTTQTTEPDELPVITGDEIEQRHKPMDEDSEEVGTETEEKNDLEEVETGHFVLKYDGGREMNLRISADPEHLDHQYYMKAAGGKIERAYFLGLEQSGENIKFKVGFPKTGHEVSSEMTIESFKKALNTKDNFKKK